MPTSFDSATTDNRRVNSAPSVEATTSASTGVSWAAIFAGAAGAAALSLILLILGTGLGLSSVSPWTDRGASATTFGVTTILWLTLTQLAASGMGGYLAGRLRTKWAGVHTDEVYFRDTAHGFLAWAVATLTTAALLSSVISSILGTGVEAGASVSSGAVKAASGAVAAKGASAPDGMGYFVDSLFRKEGAATGSTDGVTVSAQSAEVTRIIANDLRTGNLTTDDTHYVGQLVSQRTGLSQADAEKRVAETFTKIKTTVEQAETTAREDADKARKASAGVALWLFISMLIGAFVASYAATLGGRRRDL